MKRLLIGALAAALVATPAEARITTTEAERAAELAAERGPWVETRRLSGNLMFLRATESKSRQYTDACPFETDCGPCLWTESLTTELLVWVRELRGGRYRVRDNLGFTITVR